MAFPQYDLSVASRVKALALATRLWHLHAQVIASGYAPGEAFDRYVELSPMACAAWRLAGFAGCPPNPADPWRWTEADRAKEGLEYLADAAPRAVPYPSKVRPVPPADHYWGTPYKAR